MGWIEAWVYHERDGPRRRAVDDRITAAPQPRDEEAGARGDAPAAKAAPREAPPVAGRAPEGRTSDGLSSRDSGSGYPGTGWGAPTDDPVTVVRFDPAPRPSDSIVLRYEYAPALRALGIPADRVRDRLRERDRGEGGFAQPPRMH
jgi:hypothetical protein